MAGRLSRAFQEKSFLKCGEIVCPVEDFAINRCQIFINVLLESGDADTVLTGSARSGYFGSVKPSQMVLGEMLLGRKLEREIEQVVKGKDGRHAREPLSRNMERTTPVQRRRKRRQTRTPAF